MQNLFSLYQAAAEILARGGKDDEAVTLLRQGINRIGGGGNSYKLAESAILIASDFGRADLIDVFELNGEQRVFRELI